MNKQRIPRAALAFERLQQFLEERARESGAECPPLLLVSRDEVPGMRHPDLYTRYREGEEPEVSGVDYLCIWNSHYAEPSNAKFTYCGLCPLHEITLGTRFRLIPEHLDAMNIYKNATWILPESFQCPRCYGKAEIQEREKGDRNLSRYRCRTCDWPMLLVLRPTIANAAALYLPRTPGKLRKTRLRSAFR